MGCVDPQTITGGPERPWGLSPWVRLGSSGGAGGPCQATICVDRSRQSQSSCRMDLGYLSKGFAIGFSIAAPVGPIGILCIRRSLADGLARGLAAGLGAATADAAYGCVAGFGLTAVSGFLVHHRVALEAVGGVFLCYLGLRTAFSAPGSGQRGSRQPHLRCLCDDAFPHAREPGDHPVLCRHLFRLRPWYRERLRRRHPARPRRVSRLRLLVAILSGSVSLLRARFTAPWMRAVNRLSGAVLLAFGLYALARALWAGH